MEVKALGQVPGWSHGAILSCLRLWCLFIEASFGVKDRYSLWAGAPQSRLGYDASCFQTCGVCARDVVF